MEAIGPFGPGARDAQFESDLMLARLMRFYPGLTVADHDAMPWRRLQNLITLMETVQNPNAPQA